MRTDIDSIFQEKPQWCYRGDPFMWAYLRDWISKQDKPESAADFASLIEQGFNEKVAGCRVNVHGVIFVEEYNHGGLSGGAIDPRFWDDELFPLLRERYEALNKK